MNRQGAPRADSDISGVQSHAIRGTVTAQLALPDCIIITATSTAGQTRVRSPGGAAVGWISPPASRRGRRFLWVFCGPDGTAGGRGDPECARFPVKRSARPRDLPGACTVLRLVFYSSRTPGYTDMCANALLMEERVMSNNDGGSCFAARCARSMDELSGRTTGRLGYVRPRSACAIGGTAELALRYFN